MYVTFSYREWGEGNGGAVQPTRCRLPRSSRGTGRSAVQGLGDSCSDPATARVICRRRWSGRGRPAAGKDQAVTSQRVRGSAREQEG
jgi:hypothetical protein